MEKKESVSKVDLDVEDDKIEDNLESEEFESFDESLFTIASETFSTG